MDKVYLFILVIQYYNQTKEKENISSSKCDIISSDAIFKCVLIYMVIPDSSQELF
jgi:hypothetical protein